MADFLYANIKAKMLSGGLRGTGNDIVAVLVSAQYAPSVNHATLQDIPASARVAISDNLTGKTVNVNVVDADDVTISSVSGPEVNAIILAVDSGDEATSWLICHLDSSVTGLPFEPAGDVLLSWSNDTGRIFAL